MKLDAELIREAALTQTRRHFFGTASLAALNGIFARNLPAGTHFAPTAKRVIYLHLVGAPPQMDLFDHKPKMGEWFDKELPESIRMGQRLTTMTSGAGRLPVAPSPFRFAQHGQTGAWVSELLPHTARMVDDLAIVRSLHTEAINHEPAITFIQTGSQIPGKPCMGAWVAYGLGSLNQNLPAFVVLNATHTHPKANVQAISTRLWSAGFLSSEYSGVALRSSGDPVLYLKDPNGVTRSVRRTVLDCIDQLNRLQHAQVGAIRKRWRVSSSMRWRSACNNPFRS